jgi:ribA/ribD-fused uncharacterized protein
VKKYHFFWKSPVLSQWGPSKISIDGNPIQFVTAEQAMMYGKCNLFVKSDSSNLEIAKTIMREKIPYKQKQLGRRVKGFIQDVWDDHKFGLVYTVTFYKFMQNPHLLKVLLDINCDEFVEASPVDTIWGIGLAADDPRALHEETWLGENLLGFAITLFRNDYLQSCKYPEKPFIRMDWIQQYSKYLMPQ